MNASTSSPASPEIEALLEQLFPLIVPNKLFQGGVPIAQRPLGETGFVHCWGLRSKPGAFMYLTSDKAAILDDAAAGWQARAMRNMVTGQPVNTHEKKSAAGKLLWCGLMHADAFGSSRVLLSPAWEKLFPAGYWLALPDRSCGMILSKAGTNDETDDMRSMIAKMFAGATTPMSDELFEPEQFAIPPAWLP